MIRRQLAAVSLLEVFYHFLVNHCVMLKGFLISIIFSVRLLSQFSTLVRYILILLSYYLIIKIYNHLGSCPHLDDIFVNLYIFLPFLKTFTWITFMFGMPAPGWELIYIMFDMFFAGSETTVNTFTWLCSYLAAHPQVQRKLHAEIDEVIPDGALPTLAEKPR